ncbi:Uncharacterised protein [Vibrio cholerae]|nr:Uncharacterised protein [Vibrio cholerae]
MINIGGTKASTISRERKATVHFTNQRLNLPRTRNFTLFKFVATIV